MFIQKDPYDYMVTPFFERITRKLPLPYQISWLIISEIIFLFHYLVLLFFADDKYTSFEYLLVESIAPILLALIIISIISFSKRLENFTLALKIFINLPEDKLLEWYSALVNDAFSSKRMVAYGLPLGLLCVVLAIFTKPLIINSPIAEFSFCVLLFFLGFSGGCMLSSMIGIGKIIYLVGNIKNLKVSIYQHPSASIKAAGKLLFSISVSSLLIYLIGLVYVYLKGALEGFFVSILMTVFALWVIGYFIFPQMKIHELMVRYKHKRIRDFSTHIDNALEGVLQKPSRENLEHVKELFEIQKELNGMSEWPFDTKLIFTLISLVIVPVMIALIEVFSK